jgi:hypothetical protein
MASWKRQISSLGSLFPFLSQSAAEIAVVSVGKFLEVWLEARKLPQRYGLLNRYSSFEFK